MPNHKNDLIQSAYSVLTESPKNREVRLMMQTFLEDIGARKEDITEAIAFLLDESNFSEMIEEMDEQDYANFTHTFFTESEDEEEDESEIEEEEDEEDAKLDEAEKGQFTAVGGTAAVLFGGAPGLLLYTIYKVIKKKYEAAKLRCDNLKGFERDRCMVDARLKEIDDKKAAIKKAEGKALSAAETDEKKKKIQYKSAKAISKLDNRIAQIKKRGA